MNAIDFLNISKYYDHGKCKALDDVTLSIEQGDFFALLGPNGAGKTTLILILGGIVRPSTGFARVMGYDTITHYREARRAVGIVPQELVFDPFLTVRETLQFQSGYFGIRNNNTWIDTVLENLGLTKKADCNMRELSGGMKRRVMTAQSLVHRPPVIVLDEPTAGVDVALRQSLWSFIQTLNQQGHTIVLTTHYLEEAETLCRRIAMLKQGKLLLVEKKEVLMGHTHRLLIRMTGENLPSSLSKWIVTHTGENVEFKLGHDDDLPYILSEMIATGIKIREMEIVKPDLETIFVERMNQC